LTITRRLADGSADAATAREAAMTLMKPKDPDFAAVVAASFARQGLMRALGITLARIEPGLCELCAPFSPEVSQQHGYFHGALIGAALDSAGGYAALSLMPPGSEVLSTEYKVNFVAPALGEALIATGRVIKPGRTLTVTEVRAFCRQGDRHELCAIMLQSLMRIERQGHPLPAAAS
jgi:uncharacterized protein (TIGR00369 family)